MIYLALLVLGLALGSFTNALVWRLREQEQLKKAKKKPTKDQLASLSISKGRSMCPSCKHELAWYDLVPVLSWLTLKGRCRYCDKAISGQYPLIELLVGTLTILSYYAWPLQLDSMAGWLVFGIWAVILVIFTALLIYDVKWMELPNRLVYPLYAAVAGFVALEMVASIDSFLAAKMALISIAGGFLILGGLFWVIYQLSGGKWIGGGDVRLGFALGVLLGWQKSLLALTLAAYLGTLVIVALMLVGKYHRKVRIPFGPMLIIAAIFSMLWGRHVIDLYKRLSGL